MSECLFRYKECSRSYPLLHSLLPRKPYSLKQPSRPVLNFGHFGPWLGTSNPGMRWRIQLSGFVISQGSRQVQNGFEVSSLLFQLLLPSCRHLLKWFKLRTTYRSCAVRMLLHLDWENRGLARQLQAAVIWENRGLARQLQAAVMFHPFC